MFSKAFNWLSESIGLFKKAWFVFVLQTAFVFLTIAVSYLMKIFLLSSFLYIIQLVLTAGIFISFDRVKNDQKITFDNLFDGFSNNFTNLLWLSIIFLIFSLFVSYALVKFADITNLPANYKNYKNLNLHDYLLIPLIMIFDIIINFILMLAIPFISIKKMNALQAVQFSISIFFKNLPPLIYLFFIYILLSVLATVSLVGWFILFPVGIGTIYAIFRENHSI